MKQSKKAIIERAIMALALLGAAAMVYLWYLHVTQSTSAVCELSANLSCEVANTSVYSELLGVPVSALGLVYFLLVFLLYFRRAKKRHLLTVYLSIFSLVFSLYLTGTEIFVLKAICIFCEASKALMTVILISAWYLVKGVKQKISRQAIIWAIIFGLLAVGFAYLVQKEKQVNGRYIVLAECLRDGDVKMYGAFSCPACSKQKKLFGNEAFEIIGEIECDPRGEHAQTELCVDKDIQKTPTWIHEADGNEIKRLVGVQSLEKLASEFGCSNALPN